jgi:uncharacterized lipoprotein YddW (UPF0748 family)
LPLKVPESACDILAVGHQGLKRSNKKNLEVNTWIKTCIVLHKFSDERNRELLELIRKQLRQLTALHTRQFSKDV